MWRRTDVRTSENWKASCRPAPLGSGKNFLKIINKNNCIDFSFMYYNFLCIAPEPSVTGIVGNISSLIPDWSEGHDCTAIGLHGGGMILDI